MKEPGVSYSTDEEGNTYEITEYDIKDKNRLLSALDDPNYTQIPNQLLGSWEKDINGESIFIPGAMSDMSESELKICLALCRLTYGFHRLGADGSIGFLMEMTGMSRQGVLNGMERLVDRGFFVRSIGDRGIGEWQRVEEKEEIPQGSLRSRPPLVNEVDHPSQRSRPNKESIKKVNKVTAHSPSVQPPADLKDLEYVDLDELEEVTRPKWQIPDTFEQEAFLSNCNAKWYKSGQKSKVKAILKAADAGDVLGDRVYEECASAIKDIPDLDKRRLPPLPRSWLKWRFEHAIEHRWSVDGLIKAILNRDALMRHCEYNMKNKPKGRVENGKYIIEIPEGGPR